MQHTRAGQIGLAQQIQGIGARLAGMNNDWLTGLASRLQVAVEGDLLLGGHLWLVMVIKPGFADGDHAGVIQRVQQPVQVGRCLAGQIQRVNADTAIHIGILLCDLLDGGRVRGINPNTQKLAYTALPGGVQGGVQRAIVGGQVKAIQVAVGVDQHAGLSYIVWVGRSDFRAPAR